MNKMYAWLLLVLVTGIKSQEGSLESVFQTWSHDEERMAIIHSMNMFPDPLKDISVDAKEGLAALAVHHQLQEQYGLRLMKGFFTLFRAVGNSWIDNFSQQWYHNQKADHGFKKELIMLRVQGAQEIISQMGQGIYNLLGDRERLFYVASAIVGITGSYYIIKRSTQVATDYIAKRLNKPQLLTETTWVSPLTRIVRIPWDIWAKLWPASHDSLFARIVLPAPIKDTIGILVESTMRVKEVNGFYQNILLYGNPGTGKTLFATLLARQTGMDYAIMSGSCYDQFDAEEAIVQLNKLFDWAESSSRGVILFIDEAETFLGNRSEASLKSRQLLSAFLHRTGGQSNKYMIVFATNRPDLIDTAVLNRCALKLKFSLPDMSERAEILRLHLEEQLGQSASAQIDSEHIARQMEGFSGRQIMQFVVGLRAHMLVEGMQVPSVELIDRVVQEFIAYRALD